MASRASVCTHVCTRGFRDSVAQGDSRAPAPAHVAAQHEISFACASGNTHNCLQTFRIRFPECLGKSRVWCSERTPALESAFTVQVDLWCRNIEVRYSTDSGATNVIQARWLASWTVDWRCCVCWMALCTLLCRCQLCSVQVYVSYLQHLFTCCSRSRGRYGRAQYAAHPLCTAGT